MRQGRRSKGGLTRQESRCRCFGGRVTPTDVWNELELWLTSSVFSINSPTPAECAMERCWSRTAR